MQAMYGTTSGVDVYHRVVGHKPSLLNLAIPALGEARTDEGAFDRLISYLPKRMLAQQSAQRQRRRRRTPLLCERVSGMDLHHKILEALEEHGTVIHQLTAMSPLILQVAGELVTTLRRQGKVVLCGNGGSASDAQHIAAEMQGIRLHPGTPQGLLALVLTENTALFTAISNDVGYPAAFQHQVEAIVRSNDLVIGLSTSGRSPNVIEALRAAKQLGARTVAFLGESGPLADIADIAIRIPSQSVPRIQEAHMFIGHLICEMAQRMTTGDYQTRFTASTVPS